MSTSTQNVEPDPGVLESQHKRQLRWSGRKRIGAFAATAVALVMIGTLMGCAGEEARGTDQTPSAAEAPESTRYAKAEEVATGFLEAYGAFDVERAMTYLADDASIASMGAEDDLGLLLPFLAAQGYKQILGSCEELVSGSFGTDLRCAFDFHAIRSDEIGRGPFSGSSFDLTVRDGKVVEASQDWEIEKFSPQVWEPFADWVSTAHPKDAAVMYTDGCCNARLTEESIRLWERRTQEYAKKVGR
jgi:hypothetical protein